MNFPTIRHGVSLIELLVVVALIAILISITLPAIQSAREGARDLQCKNHLKQISLAMLELHSAHHRFPSGGWGAAWVGIARRGSGAEQPGGWIYSVLPYLDENALYQLGGPADSELNRKANAMRLRTSLPIFNCPSRRTSTPLPTIEHDFLVHLRNPRQTDTVFYVGRSDYAANAGDVRAGFIFGPQTLSEGADPGYVWPSRTTMSGICFLRSEIGIDDILDGTSQTYLIGEKFLKHDAYLNGTDPGDDASMYCGYSADVVRIGLSGPAMDRAGVPRTMSLAFGSAHPSGCNFAFCDGSVRKVSYGLDIDVHRSFCNRSD